MRAISLLVFLQLVSLSHAQESPGTEGPMPMFNGVDLDGWDGDERLWSVVDGAIIGKTEDGQLEQNQFLIWKGAVDADFRLDVQFQLEGDNNSGIQYRSQRLSEIGPYVVRGYQADIHKNPAYTAMLYEERGRGILAENGNQIRIDKDGQRHQIADPVPPTESDLSTWHGLTIIAQGNRIIHQLDGKTTVDVTDESGEAASNGVIALQLHRGSAMTVRFKDIQITKLGTNDTASDNR